jgi:urea transport system substrate-binding protein
VVPVSAPDLHVALVIPLGGPAGIFGPSCEACAELAAEEVNREGGVLGRELKFVVVDGGREPERVADEVDLLVTAGEVAAVTGWHISAVRKAIAPRVSGRVPYVYTPLYEGGERTPGVFLVGETPSQQLLPSMRWMAEELRVRRWCIVGDDYVWPRGSAAAAHRYARASGAEICDEVFVRLGTERYGRVLRRVERSGAEAVLMLLVGDDAVQFNRAFARAGLDQQLLRLSTLMEENMLLASGPEGTRGLFASAGFFDSLATADSLDFIGRFSARYGPEAPVLNSLGESCYEGVRLLVQLIRRASSLDVARICAIADTVGYDGPRGAVHLRGRHLDQRVYLARADRMEFDVLAELSPTRA